MITAILTLKNYLRRLEALVNRKSAYKFIIRDWVALGDLNAAAQVLNTVRFSRNMVPVEMPAPDARRIVVIAPHPDDEMIGPGGTLIKAIEMGARVRVIYLTSSGDESLEAEADSVGKNFGFERYYLRHQPHAIPNDHESVTKLAEAIVEFTPDAVFVPFFLDDNDDHRRASDLLVKVAALDHLKATLPVWAYQVYTAVLPNVIVDITSTADRKAEAIRQYYAQNEVQNWSNFALGLNAWNSRFLRNRSQATFAEAFFVLPLVDYADFAKQYFGPAGDYAYYASSYH